MAGTRDSGVYHSTVLDTDLRYVAEPAASGPTIRGAVLLSVPSDSLDAAVHRMWATLTVAGLAVLGAVAALGLALARWTTRPVRALEQATDQLASGTLAAPAATNLGPPELRRLAATFNHTATRLQRLLHEQRSFAADASHQLRTPLTALRLRLENLEPDLTGAGQTNLDAALTEIDRLADMIEQLLALARVDTEDITPTPVDLDPVITDRAGTWTPLAGEKGVRITITGNPVGTVSAIPGAVEQILDNLISNALRVVPAGSTITLHRHRPRHQLDSPATPTVMLHVIDQGPGMSPQQRARALDRFWRAPDAPKDGAGLGLAIVAKLVQASDGQITLKDADGGGLDAAIALRPVPVAVPAPSRQAGRRARHTWPASRHHATRPPTPTSPSQPVQSPLG